ncbi:MAG TPA: cytidine deaminase [Vicinamibacterales bacterium]|nr:cytidine deaminase [Vicinamibacterales bacterium]
MSDSDRRKPGWPEVERRSTSDRRTGGERRHRGDAVHRQEDTVRYNPAERRTDQRRTGQSRRDESLWRDVPVEAGDEPRPGLETALVAAAIDARTRAHASRSGFRVGAALETSGGVVVTGCNVENASYGLALCAERVALVKALSEGHEIFTRIAVVADTEQPTPPCGACRQLLWEYCGDIEVVLANLDGTTASHRLSALLPLPFDDRLLPPPST